MLNSLPRHLHDPVHNHCSQHLHLCTITRDIFHFQNTVFTAQLGAVFGIDALYKLTFYLLTYLLVRIGFYSVIVGILSIVITVLVVSPNLGVIILVVLLFLLVLSAVELQKDDTTSGIVVNLLVAGVVVGDSNTVAVPATVFRRRLKTVILHQSNVALHQLPKIPGRHLECVLLSPIHTQSATNSLPTLAYSTDWSHLICGHICIVIIIGYNRY